MSYFDELRRVKSFGGEKAPKEKKNNFIAPKSEKKLEQEKKDKESGTDAAMDKFYEDARKKMVGVCILCNSKTEKDNDKTYRNSIAHLFAKRKNQFPSIKLHPENFIELCFFGKSSCHTNFDNSMITLEDIKYQNPDAWKVIVEKAKILYRVMTKQEQNRVPEILLKEILYPF